MQRVVYMIGISVENVASDECYEVGFRCIHSRLKGIWPLSSPARRLAGKASAVPLQDARMLEVEPF